MILETMEADNNAVSNVVFVVNTEKCVQSREIIIIICGGGGGVCVCVWC